MTNVIVAPKTHHTWLEHRTMSRPALTEYLTTLLWRGFSGLEGATAAQSELEADLSDGR